MEANTKIIITNEMLMEQFMEMKSMIINLQSATDILKNPVDDFTNQMCLYLRCHRDASC